MKDLNVVTINAKDFDPLEFNVKAEKFASRTGTIGPLMTPIQNQYLNILDLQEQEKLNQ